MTSDRTEQRTDEALARSAAAGDLAAFDELVRRYEHRVYSFIYGKTRHRQTAEDLVQETFVRAYQAINRFDDRYRFTTWLFTIGQRVTASHFRRSSARERNLLGEYPATTSPSPTDVAMEREDRKTIWAVARTVLPEAQYTALLLKYGEEMSTRETATVMNRSTTGVKVLLHRGRKALAQAMRREVNPVPQPAASRGGPPSGNDRTALPDRRRTEP